jgi:hypothetical protein
MGGACGTHVRKVFKVFGRKARRKEVTRKMETYLGRGNQNGPQGDWLGGGGVEWIQLAQDRDRWRAVVCAAMNLRVVAPRN